MRRMTAWLQRQGYAVNEKRVRRLVRTMGLMAIYPKHMIQRKARESRHERQLDRMWSELREELPGGHHQNRNRALQPVGGHGILHQAPDALDGILLMGGVGGQPQEDHAGMGRTPAFDAPR